MPTSALLKTRAQNLWIRRNYSNDWRPRRKQNVCISAVSASQPQQATSNYLSPALYARATAAIVPAAHHVSPAILQFGVSVEFPVASSQEQQRGHPSRGLRFACGVVVALTDGVSVLSRLVGLWLVWFQSEYLEALLVTLTGLK